MNSEALLMHCCCGPCAEYPIKELMEKGFDLTLLYYNPNIHPLIEWQRRLESLQILASQKELPLIIDEDFREDFWRQLGAAPMRCELCYSLRLAQTAEYAVSRGFKRFSSSLLISPYQSREAILAAGRRAAAQTGTEFIEFDFREHFREGQEMAKADELYRQKYCGCILSLEESTWRSKIEKQQADYLAKRNS